MNAKEYLKEAGATDERDYSEIIKRMSDPENARLIHYLIGLETEVGELQDALKKAIIYGKPIDRVNIVEECGDVCWYLSRVLSLFDSTFEDAMGRNIAKLKARYGNKFTEHAALNRDLEKERSALEKQ